MSELTKLESIKKETFNAPTTWKDNDTPLNAKYLGNNSAAIKELQYYLNNTTSPKINEIINIINTVIDEGLGAAVKIITWGSEE